MVTCLEPCHCRLIHGELLSELGLSQSMLDTVSKNPACNLVGEVSALPLTAKLRIPQTLGEYLLCVFRSLILIDLTPFELCDTLLRCRYGTIKASWISIGLRADGSNHEYSADSAVHRPP